MRSIILTITSLFFIFNLSAQVQDTMKVDKKMNGEILEMESKLTVLGKAILQDTLLINRQNANLEFCEIFEKLLDHPDIYTYSFDSLITVSKLISPDESFRVFTWQLFEADDIYTYIGYILHNDGSWTSLKDASSDYFTPEFEVGDKDHWYGALYYKMVPFQSAENKTRYLVFGYDGNSLMERRKVIDVLSFDEEGNPTFGEPVFVSSKESVAHPPVMHRILIEYFANAKVSCNFNEIHNQIIYPHLVFMKTPEGEFMIPDGSYEGYVYEEGKWRHNVKVFNQVQDEPPFPEPVLNKEDKKNLFGKKYKRAVVNPNRSKKANEEIRKKNQKLRKQKRKAQEEN